MRRRAITRCCYLEATFALGLAAHARAYVFACVYVRCPAAAIATDPEPMFPGLSADDVLTLYFTKATNQPDVSTTAKLQALVTFTPPLASVYRASWQSGGDATVLNAAERLVIVLSGTVNGDVMATLVPSIRFSISASGGLRDAAGVSQNVTVANGNCSGTWGDASQPLFLASYPAVALDYGAQAGLGSGDALVLRFNQPVRQVPVGNKTAVDALLAFSPSNWATNYSGSWLDYTTLLVTAVTVPSSSASNVTFRTSTAVGALGVTILPSGSLTSLDGTSVVANASTLVSHGSWGDVVCDSEVLVYSYTALMVGFTTPVNASYSPVNYSIQVSTVANFVPANTTTTVVQPGQAVVTSPRLGGNTLYYVLPGLTTDVGYSARVASVTPLLPSDLVAVLPAAVPLVYTPLGATGCACSSVVSGTGCGSVSGGSSMVAPRRPVVGTSMHFCRAVGPLLLCRPLGTCMCVPPRSLF